MRPLKTVFIALTTSLLLTGCFPFSQFESARTEGAGNAFVGGTVLGYVLQDTSSEIANPNGLIGFTSFELQGGYGINDRTDVRALVNVLGFVNLDVKYMFKGDQQSRFAMSSGLGFSVLTPSLVNTEVDPNVMIHLPLYMSWHNSKGSYFSAIPKVSYLLILEGKDTERTPFIGGTFGGGYFLRNKIELFGGLGFTAPLVFSSEELDAKLFQIGLGLRYHWID